MEGKDKMKGPWTTKEDMALQKLIERHGPRNWSLICKGIPARSGKSCRLRWCNQLSPEVEHRPFSCEEDVIIKEDHGKRGNKWATIARLLPGRTDNAIKNRWNSSLCKQQACQAGADVAYPLSSLDGRKRSVSNESSSWVGESLELETDEEEEAESTKMIKRRRHHEGGQEEVSHVYKPVPAWAPLTCKQNSIPNDPVTSLSLSLPGSTEIFSQVQVPMDTNRSPRGPDQIPMGGDLLPILQEMIAAEVRRYMPALIPETQISSHFLPPPSLIPCDRTIAHCLAP